MNSKQLKAQAIPVREYVARKFLIATALLLASYLALVPIFQRLAD